MGRSAAFPPPARPLRAVTFDLDGLMFNTEELYQEVGSVVLGRRGLQFEPPLIDQMMGRKHEAALQMMIEWGTLDATVEELAAESALVMAELLPRKAAPMPGMTDLLAALEESSIPRGIATSSSRPYVESLLALFNWRARFSFVIASDDVTHGKPDPEPYLLAAGKHGVAPAEMLVLEDSQLGCQAAVASGAYAVAVPAGRSVHHEFPGVAFQAASLADWRIYAALGLAPA